MNGCLYLYKFFRTTSHRKFWQVTWSFLHKPVTSAVTIKNLKNCNLENSLVCFGLFWSFLFRYASHRYLVYIQCPSAHHFRGPSNQQYNSDSTNVAKVQSIIWAGFTMKCGEVFLGWNVYDFPQHAKWPHCLHAVNLNSFGGSPKFTCSRQHHLYELKRTNCRFTTLEGNITYHVEQLEGEPWEKVSFF